MTDRNTIIAGLKERFKNDIVEFFDKSSKRIYIEIKTESLIVITSYLLRDLSARFNIASGLDCRSHIEILYHFTLEDINLIISLRVKLSRENPTIESLACAFEGANWIERELNEMLGIKFTNHPDMRNLLLPDNWPKDVYPLRCDYKEWDDTAIRDRGV